MNHGAIPGTAHSPSTANRPSTANGPSGDEGRPPSLDLKPSLWFIPLSRLGSIAMMAFVTVVGVLVLDSLASTIGKASPLAGRVRIWGIALAIAGPVLITMRLVWQTLEWLARRFTLTDRHIAASGGVLSRWRTEMPLESVKKIRVVAPLRQRLVGLESIGVASTGDEVSEVVWHMVPRRLQLADQLRARCAMESNTVSPGLTPDVARAPKPIVIGIAGGIGSGKSAVARELARHGAVVIDSDREAREALDQPAVRDELVGWWGAGILGENGRIDRGKVGGIVFSDPSQRSRLEKLVHPIVRRRREEFIAQAGGAPFVVIDAPLLFEAGVDRECDVILFVDAPREQRLARVNRHRGWDDAELDRRENAQWPLERKRQLADDSIVNDGDEALLAPRVVTFLNRIRRGELIRPDAPPRDRADAREG